MMLTMNPSSSDPYEDHALLQYLLRNSGRPYSALPNLDVHGASAIGANRGFANAAFLHQQHSYQDLLNSAASGLPMGLSLTSAFFPPSQMTPSSSLWPNRSPTNCVNNLNLRTISANPLTVAGNSQDSGLDGNRLSSLVSQKCFVQSPSPSNAAAALPVPLRSVPSARSGLAISQDCKSVEEVIRTLHVLGSTLRSKADVFIDASLLEDPGKPRCVRGGVSELFPDKLYRMLGELEEEGLCGVISFLPHGRAFKVHDMKRFLKEVLPRYFRDQNKWSSFSRQLNLYGFLRASDGPDDGAYYHELFLKGRPNLCHYMRRVGAPSGLDRRRYKLPEGEDPNFYSMKPILPMDDAHV